MELDTCVRHNIPVVTVISNNAGWTARTPDRRKPGRELGFTNYDGMARELGAYGERVEDPNEIKPALQRRFDSGKPAVINAIVEPTAGGVSRAWGGSAWSRARTLYLNKTQSNRGQPKPVHLFFSETVASHAT
ncbi:Acetolactate synthase large subunit IlvG [Geodia barretti]|uniref:Acetolactate synthase large subunit IlvG n=1 Tax=Geodia barretti TaxID=519541 RepID=A0AA35X0A4_GEOBA|nr:Acetolactate synthase large subunit IlvG [Geodia barretti]